MADLCSSHTCARRITTGSKMVQVARGCYRDPAITPTLEKVDSEWHEHCYEGELTPQSRPYICHTCNQPIRDGDFVSYITIGFAPEEGYLRPEQRGYELARIEHVRCPARASRYGRVGRRCGSESRNADSVEGNSSCRSAPSCFVHHLASAI